MSNNKIKKRFLGGFGNESMVEEFFLAKNSTLRPGTIISQNEEAYKIEVGIPFLQDNDINIELIDDKLVVSGKGKIELSEKKDKERLYKGVFHITDDVLKDEIEAEFKEGLLTITFPKKKIQAKHETAVLSTTSK